MDACNHKLTLNLDEGIRTVTFVNDGLDDVKFCPKCGKEL